MMRPLPRPATTAECYLAAVVDRLDQLNATLLELSGRLGSTPQPAGEDEDSGEGVVRLREPAEPGPTPVRLREPDVPEPPRHGKGSSRQAWADYAREIGVDVTLDAGQRDIIAAVDAYKRAA